LTLVAQIPSATLVVMMFAMGLGLTPADFARVLKQPRAALLGVTGQLVVLPALALAVAISLPLSPTVAAGLMLLAACPGSSSSNALAHLARGDLALSISLTAVSSLVAFAWLPAVLALALPLLDREAAGITLPFAGTVGHLALTIAAPIVAGLVARGLRPDLAERWRGPLLKGSIGVLLLLIAALPFGLAARGVDLASLLRQATGAVVLLLAATTGLALLAARAARLDRSQSVTLALEVGIQNFNLAMVVALQLLREPELLGTAIAYLPAMLATGGGLVACGRRTA